MSKLAIRLDHFATRRVAPRRAGRGCLADLESSIVDEGASISDVSLLSVARTPRRWTIRATTRTNTWRDDDQNGERGAMLEGSHFRRICLISLRYLFTQVADGRN